jgi:hypothetical protein
MITTSLFPPLAATALHRVSGAIELREAEQGAAEGLQAVRRLAAAERSLNMVLDLRGAHFVTLQAHKVWSQGFARHPELQSLVRAVAIVGDDTPAFRAEQALLETARVRFFLDQESAAQRLAQVSGSEA